MRAFTSPYTCAARIGVPLLLVLLVGSSTAGDESNEGAAEVDAAELHPLLQASPLVLPLAATPEFDSLALLSRKRVEGEWRSAVPNGGREDTPKEALIFSGSSPSESASARRGPCGSRSPQPASA